MSNRLYTKVVPFAILEDIINVSVGKIKDYMDNYPCDQNNPPPLNINGWTLDANSHRDFGNIISYYLTSGKKKVYFILDEFEYPDAIAFFTKKEDTLKDFCNDLGINAPIESKCEIYQNL